MECTLNTGIFAIAGESGFEPEDLRGGAFRDCQAATFARVWGGKLF
jgi:hypothetical protein